MQQGFTVKSIFFARAHYELGPDQGSIKVVSQYPKI